LFHKETASDFFTCGLFNVFCVEVANSICKSLLANSASRVQIKRKYSQSGKQLNFLPPPGGLGFITFVGKVMNKKDPKDPVNPV
jgi:hypothetical protein